MKYLMHRNGYDIYVYLMTVVGICWNAKRLEMYQDNEENDIAGIAEE
jgi:hypothetical protein